MTGEGGGYWAYCLSRLLPMPSMVVIARKTKVNLGGSSKGRSAWEI